MLANRNSLSKYGLGLWGYGVGVLAFKPLTSSQSFDSIFKLWDWFMRSVLNCCKSVDSHTTVQYNRKWAWNSSKRKNRLLPLPRTNERERNRERERMRTNPRYWRHPEKLCFAVYMYRGKEKENFLITHARPANAMPCFRLQCWFVAPKNFDFVFISFLSIFCN